MFNILARETLWSGVGIEFKRELKRRRRRGVLVSQWLIKNPVPRVSTLIGPAVFKYNIDVPAYARRFSAGAVKVESFPGETVYLKRWKGVRNI